MLLRRLRLCRSCRSLRTRVVLAVVLLNVVFVVCLYRGSGSGRVPPSPDRPVATLATNRPPAVPVTGTPLLDRLDTVRIRRDVRMSRSGTMEQCDGWTAGVVDLNMEEHQRWQIVDTAVQDTFVFSAYFDPRSGLFRSVVILGMLRTFKLQATQVPAQIGGPTGPKMSCRI